jgi:hypothetical protein
MVDNEEQIFVKNGADLAERSDFTPTNLSLRRLPFSVIALFAVLDGIQPILRSGFFA